MATLFLRSNNSSDVRDAVTLGYWTNTVRSNKVQVNDKVVIFSNKQVCKNDGVGFMDQQVTVGYLTVLPYYLPEEDTNWTSSREGTYLRYYARFELKDIETMPLREVEGSGRLDTLRGHLSGGFYFTGE